MKNINFFSFFWVISFYYAFIFWKQVKVQKQEAWEISLQHGSHSLYRNLQRKPDFDNNSKDN